ncbi:MAG: hypothetical protein RIR00_1534 [Pseudomonadota bacterium]|jgi:DNA-binding CsgD family transcriptional regulator
MHRQNATQLNETGLFPALEAIYDASVNSSHWPAALAQIAHLTGARQVRLHMAGETENPPPLGSAPAEDCLLLPESCGASRTRQFEQRIAPQALEACPGSGNRPCQLLSITLRQADEMPNGKALQLTLCRTPRARPFPERNQANLLTLLPHLSRALQISERLHGPLSPLAGHEARCILPQGPIILLDWELQILMANPDARKLLNSSTILEARSTRVHLADPALDRQFQSHIRDAALHGRSSVLEVSQDPSCPLSQINIDPAPAGCGGSVQILLDRRRRRLRLDALAQRFGLTLGEQRVLSQLIQGDPPKEISRKMDLSVATVRSHLSNLYTKTGTSGQNELIRLALHPDNR